ncbi:carboxymuconolactone decarboxylase family protein [Bradyrhizobium sp. AUGA SZCCT0177]|uniref:carboxymuconolactone decarboxylase family protein n=1 Tax=Bradyrhizobium sp. AUGA SZCCT0177 TaxID=2807665 RepID=UPI0020137096|nr:carboxymuconolactone decarboxylase family protein [Bradyrhizobium sp. AUGA SZCCT0177]
MARIPLPTPDEMSADQRRVYDAAVSGPRGQLIGPLRAVIHSPELAARWSSLGEYLRYQTCLPPLLKELAILVTGRRWTSQIEWWVHARAAGEAGLAAAAIEAIRVGKAPQFETRDETVVYEFARQLQQQGEPDVTTYREVEQRWGVRGVVELTALVGYYTMVSMTLNSHEIPLPDGVEPPLKQLGNGELTLLPPALVSRSEKS